LKILILVYSEIQRDARVLRQIDWLKKEHQITLFAFGKYHDDDVEYFPLKSSFPFYKKMLGALLLKCKLFNNYYWLIPTNQQAYKILSKWKSGFDLIICNDIFPLPLAVKIKRNAKLIFDAHEYYPLENDADTKWMYFFYSYMDYLCKNYAPQADIMFTVGYRIAEEFVKRYNLNPLILMNLPQYVELKAKLHNATHIRLVHHGAALKGRNLELMIEIVNALDERFSLDLYLLSDNEKYINKLKAAIAVKDRIRILEPLDVKNVIAVLNQYDAGIYLLNSKSFNNVNCLPNKFFDYIQARIALIIGPSPEMKTIVEKYNCGFVTRDFIVSNIVQEISQITKEQINLYKNNCETLAKELNSDLSKKVFLDSIAELF